MVPQVPCDNSNYVDNDYLIIMMTIKIIVHTRCILFQNILVSRTQLYMYIFHFFPVSPPIGQCYTAVDNARRFPRSDDFSWNYFVKIPHVCKYRRTVYLHNIIIISNRGRSFCRVFLTLLCILLTLVLGGAVAAHYIAILCISDVYYR